MLPDVLKVPYVLYPHLRISSPAILRIFRLAISSCQGARSTCTSRLMCSLSQVPIALGVFSGDCPTNSQLLSSGLPEYLECICWGPIPHCLELAIVSRNLARKGQSLHF
jgi:hypothetical protein